MFCKWFLNLLKTGFDELQTLGGWCSLFLFFCSRTWFLVPPTKFFTLTVSWTPSFRYHNPASAYSDISDPVASVTALMYHPSVSSSTISLGELSDFLRCTFRPLYWELAKLLPNTAISANFCVAKCPQADISPSLKLLPWIVNSPQNHR